MNDLEQRLRNKIIALETQNKAFAKRLTEFRKATLIQRLIMAWKGEV